MGKITGLHLRHHSMLLTSSVSYHRGLFPIDFIKAIYATTGIGSCARLDRHHYHSWSGTYAKKFPNRALTKGWRCESPSYSHLRRVTP